MFSKPHLHTHSPVHEITRGSWRFVGRSGAFHAGCVYLQLPYLQRHSKWSLQQKGVSNQVNTHVWQFSSRSESSSFNVTHKQALHASATCYWGFAAQRQWAGASSSWRQITPSSEIPANLCAAPLAALVQSIHFATSALPIATLTASRAYRIKVEMGTSHLSGQLGQPARHPGWQFLRNALDEQRPG